MSTGRGKNLPGDACKHQQTVDDDREGYSVCVLCALVLEPIYQQDGREKFSKTIVKAVESPIISFLLDVAAHAHIPQFIIDYSISYWKKIKIQLKGHRPRITDRTLASYALYETLCRNNLPRTVQEIECITLCKRAKLFAVESALNLQDAANHPLDYVERFCSLLDIDFYEMKIIRGIVGNMFGLGGIRPQCVVAVVIFLHCKETNKDLQITKICEVCDVSSTNIYAIVRKMKKMYSNNVSLLYT